MNTRLIVPLLLLISLFAGCSTAPLSTRSLPAAAQARQLPERPEDTVAAINRRYNLVDNQCREVGTNEPRGHYYCSGVMMRAVANGPFLPWTHSPNVIERGSSSYTWFRRDMPTMKIFGAAGFILRNPVEGIASGLPVLDQGMICIYPLDGNTFVNFRHKSCALREQSAVLYPQPEARHRNQAYAWGQCEGMGILTTQAWMAFWAQDPAIPVVRRQQCSWNADSPDGWNAAISLFNDLDQQYGPALYQWNELLLDTMGDDGNMLMPYIAAFFYNFNPADSCTALYDAQTFQRKLFENGYWVPVVLMDLHAPSALRFIYRPEDQAVFAQQTRPGSTHKVAGCHSDVRQVEMANELRVKMQF